MSSMFTRVPGVLAAIALKPFKLSILVLPSISSGQAKSTNVDAIDSFTNDLVSRKSLKWKQVQDKVLSSQEAIKQAPPIATTTSVDSFSSQWRTSAVKLLQELTSLRDVELELDLRKLNQHQIDHLLINALLEERKKNFFAIVDQCCRVQRIPSDKVVFEVLDFLSQLGDLEHIDAVAQLASMANADLFHNHDGFSHFRARCIWHQGHAEQALQQLRQSYSRMRSLRLVQMPTHIIGIFREVVDDTVMRQNEQVLEAVVESAQFLSDVFGENQVLAFVWQACFLSDLFSDQQRAAQMFGDNEEVRMAVRSK